MNSQLARGNNIKDIILRIQESLILTYPIGKSSLPYAIEWYNLVGRIVTVINSS